MPRINGRLRILGAAAISITAVGTAVLALTSPAVAATAVLSESFANGLGAFTASGPVTNNAGTARLAGSLFSDAIITSAPISLSGFSQVRVSYTRTATGLDAGESFTAAYSVDGGSF